MFLLLFSSSNYGHLKTAERMYRPKNMVKKVLYEFKGKWGKWSCGLRRNLWTFRIRKQISLKLTFAMFFIFVPFAFINGAVWIIKSSASMLQILFVISNIASTVLKLRFEENEIFKDTDLDRKRQTAVIWSHTSLRDRSESWSIHDAGRVYTLSCTVLLQMPNFKPCLFVYQLYRCI